METHFRKAWLLLPGIVAILLLHYPFTFAQSLSSGHLSPVVKEFVKYDDPVIALMHVRVIDGTGQPAKSDQTYWRKSPRSDGPHCVSRHRRDARSPVLSATDQLGRAQGARCAAI